MAINPILNSGLNGVRSGLNGLNKAAQEVAELSVDNDAPDSTTSAERATSSKDVDDTLSAISDLKVYERQVQASAKVVETADEVVGFLIDTHA